MGPEQGEPDPSSGESTVGSGSEDPAGTRGLAPPGSPQVAPPPSWSKGIESPRETSSDALAAASSDALRSAPPPTTPAHPGAAPPGSNTVFGAPAADVPHDASARQRPRFGYYRPTPWRYGAPSRGARIFSFVLILVAIAVGALLGLAREHTSQAASATPTPRIPAHLKRSTSTVGHPVELVAHVGSSAGSVPKKVPVRLDVLGVTDPAPVPSGTTLPKGFQLVTVKTQACATSGRVNPFLAFGLFDVITTGGQQILLATKVVVPGELSITAQDIKPGACRSDVLPFEVPTSTPLRAIGYLTFSESVRWTLPG
jgi:hypothetical protein